MNTTRIHSRILRLCVGLILAISIVSICGCGQSSQNESAAEEESSVEQSTGEVPEGEISLTIDDTDVAVAWEDNESAAALKELVSEKPLEIDASAYGGFEQVGPLGKTLPSNDRQIETVAGDIMLYAGDQIVIFYGANTWDYTPLGKITDKSEQELEELLKGDGVKIKLEMK